MIPHDLAGRRTCLAPFDALLQVLDVAAGEAGGLDGFVQELSSAKKDYVPEFDVSLI